MAATTSGWSLVERRPCRRRCFTAGELLKTATTSDTTVVLQADFYRAGDANEESFTAQMIVSATDIATEIAGTQNLWVQGVGCGDAIVHFSH